MQRQTMIDRRALYSEAHPSAKKKKKNFLQHSQNRHGKNIIVEQKRKCGEQGMCVKLRCIPTLILCAFNSNLIGCK